MIDGKGMVASNTGQQRAKTVAFAINTTREEVDRADAVTDSRLTAVEELTQDLEIAV